MSIQIESLFGRNVEATPSILLKPGHEPTINTVGWGEPPTYFTDCSCGWKGRTIESNVPEGLLSSLKALVKLHGDEAILGPDAVFGTDRSAVREVLEHLDLPVEELIKRTHEDISIEKNSLGSVDGWKFDISGKLQKKLADLDTLIIVKIFLELEPLAVREVPFDAAVYAEVRRAIEAQYSHRG